MLRAENRFSADSKGNFICLTNVQNENKCEIFFNMGF